jgi:hypothetical protein
MMQKFKKQYRVRISKSFAALEDLDDNVDINRAWESVTENTKTSVKASQGHYVLGTEPWFDEECSKLLDRSKQAKVQWLQNPSQINGDNMANAKREASRTEIT